MHGIWLNTDLTHGVAFPEAQQTPCALSPQTLWLTLSSNQPGGCCSSVLSAAAAPAATAAFMVSRQHKLVTLTGSTVEQAVQTRSRLAAHSKSHWRHMATFETNTTCLKRIACSSCTQGASTATSTTAEIYQCNHLQQALLLLPHLLLLPPQQRLLLLLLLGLLPRALPSCLPDQRHHPQLAASTNIQKMMSVMDMDHT